MYFGKEEEKKVPKKSWLSEGCFYIYRNIYIGLVGDYRRLAAINLILVIKKVTWSYPMRE